MGGIADYSGSLVLQVKFFCLLIIFIFIAFVIREIFRRQLNLCFLIFVFTLLQMPIREACHVALQRVHPSKHRLWKHAEARQNDKGGDPTAVLQIVC